MKARVKDRAKVKVKEKVRDLEEAKDLVMATAVEKVVMRSKAPVAAAEAVPVLEWMKADVRKLLLKILKTSNW